MMLMEWQVISVRTRPKILMVTKRTSRPRDDSRKPMTAPARNAALRMASQHASLTRWQGGIQLVSQHTLDTFNAASGRSQTEAAVASQDKACEMTSQGLAKRISPAIKAGAMPLRASRAVLALA